MTKQKLTELLAGSSNLAMDAGGQSVSQELPRAVGIALLDTAGRDGDYAPEEIRGIFRTLQQQFGLSEEGVHAVLEEADEARSDRDRIESFYRTIRDTYSDEQRGLVLAMIWKIILADGNVAAGERRFADVMRVRLGLPERSGEQAENAARTHALRKQKDR